MARKPVGDRPGDVGALRVAGRIEPVDEQRQFLERVVVDVGRDARPFRLRGRDDEVALERGAGREAGQRPDREPAGQQDEARTRAASGKRYGAMSVASAISGVTPTTANSVDSRRRPLDAAAPRNPPGWIGSRGGEPRDQRDRPDQRPAGDRPRLSTRPCVATAMAMTAAPMRCRCVTTRVTSRRSSG